MSRSLDLERNVERLRRTLEKIDRMISTNAGVDEPPAASPSPPVLAIAPPDPCPPETQEALKPLSVGPKSRAGRFIARAWSTSRPFILRALATLKAESKLLIPRTERVQRFLRHHLQAAFRRLVASGHVLAGRLADTARFGPPTARQFAERAWARLCRLGEHGRSLLQQAIGTGRHAARRAISRLDAAARTTEQRARGWYRTTSSTLRGQTARWLLEVPVRRMRAEAALRHLGRALFAAGRATLHLGWTFSYALCCRAGYTLLRPITLGGLSIAIVSFALGRATSAPLPSPRFVSVPAPALSAGIARQVERIERIQILAPFPSPGIDRPTQETPALPQQPPVAEIAFTSWGRVWRKPAAQSNQYDRTRPPAETTSRSSAKPS